jgi:integrase
MPPWHTSPPPHHPQPPVASHPPSKTKPQSLILGLAGNPFQHAREERSSARRWHHLKPAEFQRLLGAVEDLRWRTFYLLAYTTGARFGELFNLVWSDINFEASTVVIQDRAGRGDMPPFLVKDHETRTLPLPRQAVEALSAWHAEAPEHVPYVLLTADRWQRVRDKWRLCRNGEPWKKDAKSGRLVWAPWQNRYMVNNVVRDMKVHLRWAALQPETPITVHTLRKSFAQNHADSGTPSATLKGLMGHASITTTETHYLQQSDANRQAAAERYKALLSGRTCVKLAYEGSNRPETPSSASDTSSEKLPSQELT